jgi:hypothetical protein
MAQLSDDCFAFGGALLPLAEAQARIAELYSCVAGTEPVTLADAVGRVLAYAAVAEIDLPPQTNSAVDGYAVYYADLSPDRPTLVSALRRKGIPFPPAEKSLAPGCRGRCWHWSRLRWRFHCTGPSGSRGICSRSGLWDDLDQNRSLDQPSARVQPHAARGQFCTLA